ncbi:MAG: FtsX-like permease family protein, partial [Myxococcota bacterium]
DSDCFADCVSYSEDYRSPALVVGVVRNFHYKSIREQIRPTFYLKDTTSFASMSVRFEPGRLDEVREAIAALWRKWVPEVPFRAELLEEELSELYRDERARALVFAAFSFLAVIIACLGLYGLASFTAARRTKEIGIRKVLGASSLDIVRLLVWQFSKPVIAANLVAWPLAAWLMYDWLQTFQYRISLDPVLFVEAGLLALSIAWLTVGGHALRFSRTRPSRALRYE